MQLIGHRGAAGCAPENSLAALRYAASVGIKQVECDISVSADDVAIVFHDEMLSRMTGDPRSVLSTRVDQLCALPLVFNDQTSTETIPRALEWFNEVVRLNLFLHCEIKVHDHEVSRVVNACVDAFHRSDLTLEHIRFSSFSWTALEQLHAQIPAASLGLACRHFIDVACFNLQKLPIDSIHLDAAHVSNEVLHRVKASGYDAYLYTVNDLSELSALDLNLIGALFTDRPDRLKHVMNPTMKDS